MSQDIRQIVASFEEAGMTPEEIAQVDGLELSAVKAILMANSTLYRDSVAGATIADDEGKDFSGADNDEALEVIKRIAKFSEDDSVALKAAMYIRNDKKRRLDPQKAAGQLVQNNVFLLNEHFAKVREAIAAKVLPASKLQPTEI